MGPSAARVPSGAWVVAFAAALASPAAGKTEVVHEIRAGADTVAGEVASPGEVDRIPFRLVAGTAYRITLVAVAGGGLTPDLALLGVDRKPDTSAAATVRSDRKGNVVATRRGVATATGLHYAEVRGASGSTGAWSLAVAVRASRKLSAAGTVDGGGASAAIPFACQGNAIAAIRVSASRGSAALPGYDGIVIPSGATPILGVAVPGPRGFVVKEVPLEETGAYVLRVKSAAGSSGPFTVRIRWKFGKPVFRSLHESEVILDPIVTGFTPTTAITSDLIPGSAVVEFARPGAQVTLRSPYAAVPVPSADLEVGESSITFPLAGSRLHRGVFDLVVRNPDGGEGVLAGALAVGNAPATLESVEPDVALDSLPVRVSIRGTYLTPRHTVELVRGEERIPGTDLSGGPGVLGASFDTLDRPLGSWDLHVGDVDIPTVVLQGAVEILNGPPFPASVSPGNNFQGRVVATSGVAGTGFDPGVSAALRREGLPEIAASSVLRSSTGLLFATFDTAGAAWGPWDVAVRNADGQEGTVAKGFQSAGLAAAPSLCLTPASPADGPPAVCYNAARDEFLLAWVEDAGGYRSVVAQRVGPTGSALGGPVTVASSAAPVVRKDVTAGWDSSNDEYLVAWSEPILAHSVVATNPCHPSYGNATLFSVFAQRLDGSDLAALGPATQVSDETQVNVNGFTWYLARFHNTRARVAWDPVRATWVVAWMQEWSIRNICGFGFDDYEVIARDLDPATDSLGAPTVVLSSFGHEGEPEVAWDPVAEKVLLILNQRNTRTSPLNLRAADGSLLASDSSADLGDASMVLDPDADRLLLTWTRRPITGGFRTVEMQLFTLSGMQKIGGVVPLISSPTADHYLARPSFNAATGEVLVAWTADGGAGKRSVRARRVDMSSSSAPVLLGVEFEISSGGGDEAAGAPVASDGMGETVVSWLRRVGSTAVTTHQGTVLPPTWSGSEVWVQRLK